MKKRVMLLLSIITMIFLAGCFSNGGSEEKSEINIENQDVIAAIMEIVNSDKTKTTAGEVANVSNGVVSGVYLKLGTVLYMYSFPEIAAFDAASKNTFLVNWNSAVNSESYIIYENKAISLSTAKSSISGGTKLSTAVENGVDSSASSFAVQPYTEVVVYPEAVSGTKQRADKKGFLYTGKIYNEIVSAGSGTPLTSADSNIVITKPSVRNFDADGYFELAGEIKYTGDLQYSWVQVIKDSTSEKTTYWLRGSFNKKIWLRYGAGSYTIKVYKTQITSYNSINEQYDGDILGWSYWTNAVYTFNVNNTRAEDGRFIYPSEFIQSDSELIYNLAIQKLSDAGVVNGTVQEKAKALHDYVVKGYYYDLTSLDSGKRKKQDALTTLANGNCVCEGYTSIYNALLRSQGIAAKAVAGQAGGGGHAWSNVYTGTVWKFVDTTWDDPLMNNTSNYPNGSNLRYSYFWLDGNTGVNNDHTWESDRTERAANREENYLFINAKEGMY